jgi:GrpB-like predicted nucleotidyltransferase (UPF0157 family)
MWASSFVRANIWRLAEIIVTEYDPEWPQMFEAIRRELVAALVGVPVAAIEHVGSTAVPGLAAKPAIDIDVVVAEKDVGEAIAALERAGYGYRGEMGVPDRHAFWAPPGTISQHTYVAAAGCLSLRNHLAVRDVLRADEGLRREYAETKARLAAETDEIEVYVEGKSAVLQRILAAAGIGSEELEAIEQINRAVQVTGCR